jgi:hypothetical protein
LDRIGARYPKHLPSIYRTVLEKWPQIDSQHLSNVLMNSNLPNPEKTELFALAAKNNDFRHRRIPLAWLGELDATLFAKLLKATIVEFKNVPRANWGGYWSCDETMIAPNLQTFGTSWKKPQNERPSVFAWSS